MKKFYLLLFMLISVLYVAGQEVSKPQLPLAAYREGMKMPALKSAGVVKTNPASFNSTAGSGGIKALLLVADIPEWVNGVQSRLLATGKFDVLEILNFETSGGVATLAQLEDYDAVLVWANHKINDANGEALAAYIDGGGGVVSAVYNLFTDYGIKGTRFNTEYLLLELGTRSSSLGTTIGTVHDSAHPVMEGVSDINNPTGDHSNNTTVTTGSVVVASCTDGVPLVVVKENLGPANARRADINYYPPEMLYGITDDAALLLANALVWVANAGNCPNDIVVDNDPGTCSAVVSYTIKAPRGGSVVQTEGLPSGSEFPIGVTNNCFTLTDAENNETTCCFTITVNDTEPPVIDCPGDIVVSNQPGECGANVNYGETLLDDVAPGSLLTNWTCYDQPGNPTFTFKEIESPYDGSTAIKTSVIGNSFSPCHSENIYRIFDVSGNTSATKLQAYLEFASNMTYYNFPYIEIELQGELGEKIINHIYYGKGVISGLFEGRAASNPGQYTELSSAAGDMVIDLSKMGEDISFSKIKFMLYNYTCEGTNSIVFDHLRVINDSADNSPTASDNCSDVTLEADIPSGSFFPVGTTTVTLTATDAAGNTETCNFNVTVVDTEAPVAVCKGGSFSGKAAYVSSTAGEPWDSNSNIDAMDLVFGAGQWDQLYYETANPATLFSGTYALIYMDGGASNANAMEAFINANRSAMETWVAEGGNLFLNAAPWEGDGMDWGFWGVTLQYDGGTRVSYAEAADPAHPIFSGPFTPVIPGPFYGNWYAHAIIPEALHATVLMYDQSDHDKHVLSYAEWGSGRVLFGGMTNTYFHDPQPEAFHLRANMLAFLSVPSLEFELDETGTVTITTADIDGGSYDNCGDVTLELDKTTFTRADLGPQQVTLTVTDGAGNKSTCTSTIEITAPDAIEVVVHPITVYLDEDGSYKFTREDLEAIAEGTNFNNISLKDLKLTAYPHIFTCEQVGDITFTRLTVEDGYGNVGRKWTTVTVLSAISPVISCNNLEVYLDENGEAVITADQILASATAVCGIESLSIDKEVFGCDDVGDNLVTLTVTGKSDNSSTCTAVVTVIDNIVPEFVPVADIEVEIEAGLSEAEIEYPEIVVIDNCEIEPALSEGIGPDGLFPVGTTTEVWTVEDGSGNSATLTFTVTVRIHNNPPTIDPIADVEVDEDAPPVIVELTGISDGDELLEQVVTVTAESDNPALVASVTANYEDGETGSLEIVLLPDMYGVSIITVTVEDEEGAQTSESFTLTVNPVNDAPVVVNPTGDQSVHASYALEIPVSPVLGELFDDADGDELEISVTTGDGGALPEWAEYTDNKLVFTPMIADTGCVVIAITATDPSGASATDSFELCVEGYPVSAGYLNTGNFSVNLFPNPARDAVSLEVKSSANRPVSVSVFNLNGKLVLRKDFSADELIRFNMDSQVSGIYFVKVQSGENEEVKKLVLNRR